MNLPYLNRYRNGEFLQYLKDILQLLGEQDIAALQLTAQHDALQPQVAAIDTAFKQSQASNITQELIALDDERDNALTGLRAVINGYQYYYEEAMANAAKALWRNIENHGNNIQRLSYQEQTAVMDSIIADWEGQSELSQAVNTLNLGEWLANLKNTNSEFTTRYLARVEEQAANPSEDIPQLREEATTAYRDLISHLQAHATLATAPQHRMLLEQISVLAGQYNQVVDNRSSGTAQSSTEENPTDDITTQATAPSGEAM